MQLYLLSFFLIFFCKYNVFSFRTLNRYHKPNNIPISRIIHTKEVKQPLYLRLSIKNSGRKRRIFYTILDCIKCAPLLPVLVVCGFGVYGFVFIYKTIYVFFFEEVT